MRRQVFLVLTLAAWLLATGSHWDLVQTFGWGRMIVTYSHSMSLSQAVEKTFSGDTLCPMCQLAQSGKASSEPDGSKLPGAKSPEKFFFVSTPGVLVYASPTPLCVGLMPAGAALVSADRPAPPLPPPRTLA